MQAKSATSPDTSSQCQPSCGRTLSENQVRWYCRKQRKSDCGDATTDEHKSEPEEPGPLCVNGLTHPPLLMHELRPTGLSRMGSRHPAPNASWHLGFARPQVATWAIGRASRQPRPKRPTKTGERPHSRISHAAALASSQVSPHGAMRVPPDVRTFWIAVA